MSNQAKQPIYDIIINQGETFTRTLNIEEPEGTPLDITSYTFASQIKKNKTDTSALDAFTFTLSDPTNGVVTMSLTDTETSALPSIIGFYDVEMTRTDTTKVRILEGRVTITQEVTT
jgi:hypothetical protein